MFVAPVLTPAERAVTEEIEELRRRLSFAIGHRRRWTGLLRRVAFARAIKGSNSIEGLVVSVEDAMAVAEGQAPLDADKTTHEAIKGYRDALTYILQLADAEDFSYTTDLIRGLHFMIQRYDLARNPGKWRPGPIYVRNDEAGEIVYEGPPVERVPQLMTELAGTLNAKDPRTPGLVRAAMAHLNLAMIHPFSDGNGRMARALQTLVLTREGILEPAFCSIEEFLGRPDNTRDYYKVLREVGGGRYQPERDARPWIVFALRAHFYQASTLTRRIKAYERIYELLDKEISSRKLPGRMTLALFDAALGFKVRNATYRPAAEIADHVARRDLKVLADAGLLISKGEKRGRYYVAGTALNKMREETSDKTPIVDPFGPSP